MSRTNPHADPRPGLGAADSHAITQFTERVPTLASRRLFAALSAYYRGQPQTLIMAPPGTFPEGCCGGRFSGGCILWPACLYIPGPEPYRWLLELSPIGCDDTPSIQLPTSTPLRETLLDAGNPSDVEAPAQSAGALSRLDERLERMEKLQLEQAHRGRVYFTYALLTLIAILYKLQNPERFGIYSTFNVYCALILYMTMNKNSERAIRGVMIFIGLSFLIAALIYFITQVIKPIFDGAFNLLVWLGWKVTHPETTSP